LDPATNKFTYEELCGKFPAGVKPNKKELYLKDGEFEKHFKMGMKDFLKLKDWKQT